MSFHLTQKRLSLQKEEKLRSSPPSFPPPLPFSTPPSANTREDDLSWIHIMHMT